MATRDRERDEYQTGGGDYTGQSQLISDDFLSQGTDQYLRSDVDRSYDSTQNRDRKGSNQYQTDNDKFSDSVGSGYGNQGSRGDTGDRSFGSSPRYGSENRESGFNRTRDDDLYSDSTRGSSEGRGGVNQYQSSTDRMSDLTPNSGGGYDRATNFLQQTGEQVKNMAQGAADAVKNTLGMNTTGETNTRQGSSTYGSEDSNYNYPSNNPSNRV